MKSAGNGGVVQSRLQVLHVHVFLAAQLGARRVAKSGADQHQGGVPVRECPHHTGAAADLTVQPLDHVVGTDAGPMLAGKIAVGQRFLCTIFSDIVCCLLSEWCVVTSFYQSLQAMSSFMRFSICATYCTLSTDKRPNPNSTTRSRKYPESFPAIRQWKTRLVPETPAGYPPPTLLPLSGGSKLTQPVFLICTLYPG